MNCYTCENTIEQERIDAYAELEMGKPTECFACASGRKKSKMFIDPTNVNDPIIIDMDRKDWSSRQLELLNATVVDMQYTTSVRPNVSMKTLNRKTHGI